MKAIILALAMTIITTTACVYFTYVACGGEFYSKSVGVAGFLVFIVSQFVYYPIFYEIFNGGE